MLSQEEMKQFLEEKYLLFNRPEFIEDDPIQIPHQFDKKEDIEISAFLVASIAWGQRKIIINNAKKLMQIMGYEPHAYIMNSNLEQSRDINAFKHRTFNGVDLRFFLSGIKNIYVHHGGLEKAFSGCDSVQEAIDQFRDLMLQSPHESRSEKHISSPRKGSASKRINMFLRWMVRKDNLGVDFGIWKALSPAQLMVPLDVHTGNIARELHLISRKQNDWKALEELMINLRKFDPQDPAKYDFALFGLGAYGY